MFYRFPALYNFRLPRALRSLLALAERQKSSIRSTSSAIIFSPLFL